MNKFDSLPYNAGARLLPAQLAVVVPTYNEFSNVALLVEAVARALSGVRWELTFVDDNSPDGTADLVRAIGLQDARVRVVHRYGRRGLSSACVEGVLATNAPYLAIMDADLQHDEAILGEMFRLVSSGDVDLVVGSRYVMGGGMGAWSKRRIAMSQLATWLANNLTRTPIGDPMSGFFMMPREVFMGALPNLSTVGFKILLDIAASSPTTLRVAEVPYTFRLRSHGESKLSSLVLWEYLQLLLDKAFGHIVPVRFMSFAIVGGFGVFIHFAVLTLVLEVCRSIYGPQHDTRWFAIAQGVATLIATSSNFFLNNLLTYSDLRLRGTKLILGWVTFNIVCGVGLLANVGIARWLYQRHNYLVEAALAGIAVTTVWNYAMSSMFTWRKR